ncbi:NlpC/P60 family protein [Tropicimonas sp.]|uniref:NlpC/P60 family protein n=1 Tax=Tropicimonas sp. TaxID=2067044 RepID=UPI003A848BA9
MNEDFTKRDDIVGIARSWIGTPYRHQASVRGSGADCLGLVRGVWRTLYGREPETVPDYTADWSEAGQHERLWCAAGRNLRQRAAADDFRNGDVLLFRMRADRIAKHVAIAASRGRTWTFIHAYSGHGVIESCLTDPWRRKIVAAFEFPEGGE